VLRKNLSSDQAVSYVARLEKMGVKVFAEPLTAAVPAVEPAPIATPAIVPPPVSESVPVTSADLPAAAPPAPALALAEPVVEEMDCPKCGERQPKRTLCRACSVDMKRFIEAQQEVQQQAQEEKAMAREIARGGGVVGADEALDGEPEKFSFFSADFSGRIGRTNYLVSSWFFLSALMMFAVWLAAKTNIWTIAVIGVIAAIVLAWRFTILRCHDANWSGWLSLILFIPYVGGLFSLILLIMPGTRGDNNYGTATRRVGWPKGLGMVALCGVSVYLLAGQAMTVYQAYLSKSGGAGSMQMQRGQKAGSFKAPVVDSDVLIYTTSTDCDECRLALSYMRDHGITWTERMVDRKEDYLREFLALGGRDVPYIVVGERTMTGFDSEQLDRLVGSGRR
jgi:uncharacterized membrane protein YhaH (DUF805 family)/glutaredoxin